MKILIISLSNLGDALLTYPAIGALWEAYPNAQFYVLASPRTRELFEADPRVHWVWIWEKRIWLARQLGRIARLAGSRFDLVVDFRNSLIPLFLLGARHTPILRLGRSPACSDRPEPFGSVHPEQGRRMNVAQDRLVEGRSGVAGSSHNAEVHLALVTALGIPPPQQPVRLPYGPEEEAQVQTWVKPGLRPVLLVPGARSHLKRWAADRFAAVADRLIEEQGAQILLVGEAAERPISEAVSRAMRGPATDLTGYTSLRQLAALLARTELVVTNDNACLHAAELMEVPTVAIFGPTDESRYGPRNPRSAVIRRTLVCAPCGLALCPYGHECMQWIEPQEVYQAAVEILHATA